MAKQPKEIILKPYIIKIITNLKSGNLGEYCPTDIAIKLKKGLKPQQKKSTVLHELGHHMCETLTFLTEDEEEAVCRTMERTLLSLIRDNKELIKWIQEDDQPGV